MTSIRYKGAVAGTDIPTGSFVKLEPADGSALPTALPDPTLQEKGGLATMPRGQSRTEVLPRGAEILVMTEGGALARLSEDAEITVRKRRVRLQACDNHYLHLRGGRVVGFQGDDRVA